jgi:alkylation response protein AidB-like acyl-CoA dehydrogenase
MTDVTQAAYVVPEEPTPDMEPVADFRARARAWLADHMPPECDGWGQRIQPGRWDLERTLQRKLWEGGFAGICFPAEYGGLGLSRAHQRAFTEESFPYDMPYGFNVPTLGILAATLLDYGTHEQKAEHLPKSLSGEALWVQFLSEPSGGSDLAGCLTRADPDGDVFIMNGSKIWSSGAADADWAMCLARTNWDVPKHRGLTMFLMEIHQPGVTVEQIRQVDGSMEFCQEFFDDVPIPAANVIGAVDDGWTVASRLLVHERLATGGGSPFTSGRSGGHDADDDDNLLVDIVREQGRQGDAHVRQLVAEAHVRTVVHRQLAARLTQGMSMGVMPPPAGSIMKLFAAVNVMRRSEIGLILSGAEAVTWPVGEGGGGSGELTTTGALLGEHTLWRQGMSLGGGSNEIQRNIISERVLGLPREYAADREVPYREVRRSGTRS